MTKSAAPVRVFQSPHKTLFFFFFQAEDGIRDKLVNGVQTCALPICGPAKNQPDQDIIGRQKAKGAGNVVQASLNQAREAASQQEDQNRNEQDAAYQSGARKHCKPPRLIGCQVHGLIQGTVEIISRYARLQELERIEALDAIAKQE